MPGARAAANESGRALRRGGPDDNVRGRSRDRARGAPRRGRVAVQRGVPAEEGGHESGDRGVGRPEATRADGRGEVSRGVAQVGSEVRVLVDDERVLDEDDALEVHCYTPRRIPCITSERDNTALTVCVRRSPLSPPSPPPRDRC